MPYQIRGSRPGAIVTDVLDPEAITRDRWIGLAAGDRAGRVLEGGPYHRRREIETTSEGLKVSRAWRAGCGAGLATGSPARSPGTWPCTC